MKLIKLYLIYYFRRIVFIITSALLISLFFVFRMEIVPFVDMPNPYYSYFVELDVWLYVIHILIVIFSILIFFELFFTVVYAILKFLLKRRMDFLHKHISDAIFDYLLEKHNAEESKQIIRKLSFLIISDDAKRIFMNWLRKAVILTRGEVYEHCLTFFLLFKNERLLRAYMRSPYLNHKLFALTIIGDFKLKNFNGQVTKRLRSRNTTLKSDAIAAYIKTNIDTDLVFLTNKRIKLTIWDFNMIVLLAKDYTKIDYLKLINAPDVTVKALGLRFINAHKRFEFKQEVIRLIDYTHPLVKEEAFLAFLTLTENEVDFETLIIKFDYLSPKLQYKTIDVLGSYANLKQVLTFFDWLILHKPIEIKTRAMAKLFEINMAYILKYKQHKNEVIRSIYSQLISISI